MIDTMNRIHNAYGGTVARMVECHRPVVGHNTVMTYA